MWALAASLGAMALGLVLYLVTTSLPYIAGSPSADANFGELNRCLLEVLGEARGGFAVSPDGQRAAAFGGDTVALCERGPGKGARRLAFPGVSEVSFDFKGVLWLAREKLYRWGEKEAPELAGDFQPVAMVGHREGVAVVDSSGKVISVASEGQKVLGAAELPQPPVSGALLSVNGTGEFVALVASGGVFVYRAPGLELVRAEGTCEVEYLWWLAEPTRALLSCGPRDRWALTLDVGSGEREEAPKASRARSVWVPGVKAFTAACDNLPCTVAPP